MRIMAVEVGVAAAVERELTVVPWNGAGEWLGYQGL